MIKTIKMMIMMVAISLFAVACGTDRCITSVSGTGYSYNNCFDSDCKSARKENGVKTPVSDGSAAASLLSISCGDLVDVCTGTKESGNCTDW